MSRVIDTTLLASYRLRSRTIATGIKISRLDGFILRAVSLNRNVTLPEVFTGSPSDDALYYAAPGVEMTSLVSTEGFKPDNAKLTVLADDDITRADILNGVWDGAEFEIFNFDYVKPWLRRDVLKIGRIGNFKPMHGKYEVEFRDIRQSMQYQHDTVLQPNCRYQVGVRNAVSHCPVNLLYYTVSGTLTGVTSGYVVTDSARSEASDWFGEGRFTFLDGLNAGISRKVKTYAAGVFTFWDQFVQPIGNDNYEVSAGCRLRHQEDCITKYGVGIDFGGEPNKRNPDILLAPA